MKNIITLFVVLLLTQPCILWAAQTPVDCDLELVQIQQRLETQRTVESDLVILLNNSGIPKLALNTLFTKFTTKPEETNTAIKELRNSTSDKDFLSLN